MQNRAVLLFIFMMVAGCSFDAASTDFSSEDLGTGFDLSEGNQDPDAANHSVNNTNNTNPNNDPANNGAEPDMTTAQDVGFDAGARDMASIDMSRDTGSTDMSAEDMAADMASDTGQPGCTRNNECPAGQVCCPNLQGVGACQTNCLVDGLCTDNSDCAAGDECCDLSGIGSQNNLCAPTCGGGGGGTACQTNSDCMGNEVCCTRFNGQNECTTSCLSGGACATNADCRGSQQCCDIVVGKQCFDRCTF